MTDLKTMDYYRRLGLSRRATTDEIKAAYLELARIFDPDSHFYDDLLTDQLKVTTPKHLETMEYITESYNTLIDIEKRAAYDRMLSGLKKDPTPRPTESSARPETSARGTVIDSIKKWTVNTVCRFHHTSETEKFCATKSSRTQND